MAWFRDLKLYFKISIIVALAVVAFSVNLIYTSFSIVHTHKNLVLLEQKLYEVVQLATVNNVLLKRSDELFSQAVSFDDEDLKRSALDALGNLASNISTLNRLDTLHTSELGTLHNLVEDYRTVSVEIVHDMLSGQADMNSIGQRVARKTGLFEQADRLLVDYKNKVDVRFFSTISSTREKGEATLKFSLLLGLALITVLLVVALSVARSISGTANAIALSLDKLANGQGNLNHHVPVLGRDELGTVSTNFNRFMQTLLVAVKRVLSLSQPLADSSALLLETSRSATKSMEEQATNAQFAGNAMLEFRNSLQEVTASATEAQSAVKDSGNEIKTGLQTVDKTIANSVEFGEQINQAAQSVQDLAQYTISVNSILDVIKSISEQTNLLALNAAIEAARAGDQGRGFAVVADEVRTLASRSGEATTEIFQVLEKLRSNAAQSVELMQQSQEKSAINVQYSKETGAALEKTRQSIDVITALNEKIAASTHHQNEVIEELITTVETMNSSVEACKESFGELDSMAHDLHKTSESLNDATGRFRL